MKEKIIDLGDRVKSYEAKYETIVQPEEHIIVRIDGHHFSNFTSNFEKPFDLALQKAMQEATKDALQRFDAYSAYTQSDEITLFIPSLKDLTVDNREKKSHKLHKRIREDYQHIFSGRTHKISSLVASYVTKSFNKHLRKILMLECISEETTQERKDKVFKMLNSHKVLDEAYFDARVFGVKDLSEVANVFIFRSRDCIKNSKASYAQGYCSHKELQNKNSEEQIEYLKNKTSKDWNYIHDSLKYGTLAKRESYIKELDNNEKCRRTRTIMLHIPMNTYSDDLIKLITSKVI